MGERGTPEEIAEFAALSAKVSEKKASEPERVRWRALRTQLARRPPPPPPGASGSKARQHVRATKKLRVGFVPVKELDVSFTEEVGAGGVRLMFKQHVDVGAQFVLRLELAGPNDPDPVTLAAKVVWVMRDGNHFQVGFEFTGLRPDERERIEAYALSAKDTPAPPKP